MAALKGREHVAALRKDGFGRSRRVSVATLTP